MITEKEIFLDVTVENKAELFEFLATKIVAEEKATDVQEVILALWKREEEFSTGMMDSFAIPHAKSEAIVYPTIIVVKLTQPIAWQSLDGGPIQYIFALFVPESQKGTTQLTLLTKVARLLMNGDFRKQFSKAKTKAEVSELLRTKLEEK